MSPSSSDSGPSLVIRLTSDVFRLALSLSCQHRCDDALHSRFIHDLGRFWGFRIQRKPWAFLVSFDLEHTHLQLHGSNLEGGQNRRRLLTAHCAQSVTAPRAQTFDCSRLHPLPRPAVAHYDRTLIRTFAFSNCFFLFR